MKKLLGMVLAYILLAVLLLPLVVTLVCGGFDSELPRQARGFYDTGIVYIE